MGGAIRGSHFVSALMPRYKVRQGFVLDLYALGLAGVPVADYPAAYEDEAEVLRAYDRTLFGGGGIEDLPDLYAERSPMTYIENVRAPVLILASLVLARPMTLVFEPLELLVLGLSTAIFAYISLDGESHWLEGTLLLALYLMTAVVFFFDPLTVST